MSAAVDLSARGASQFGRSRIAEAWARNSCRSRDVINVASQVPQVAFPKISGGSCSGSAVSSPVEHSQLHPTTEW